jgi:hypothetical protein
VASFGNGFGRIRQALRVNSALEEGSSNFVPIQNFQQLRSLAAGAVVESEGDGTATRMAPIHGGPE